MAVLTEKAPLSAQTLEAQFCALPEDTTREFELTLTMLSVEEESEALRPCLLELLDDTTRSQDVRYAAFYTLVILERNNLNNADLNGLFKKYRSQFSEKTSMDHLFLTSVLRQENIDFSQYLEIAEASAAQMPTNSGYTHLLAEMVARAVEETEDPVAREALRTEWYPKGLSAINHAIHHGGGYAKYRCTKGRLLATNGLFDAADAEIRCAIDEEDSSRSDYSIRIGQYQYYRIQVQANKKIFQIQEDSAHMKAEVAQQLEALKGSLMSNVEIIAFFAGIISFIIGSLTLASGHTAREACAMIMALLGCLLGAFSGLGALLHTGDLRRRLPALIAVALMGAAFLVGGIFLV